MQLHRYEGMVQGMLMRRYKRFLADVVLQREGGAADLEATVVHCPNTGSMEGLLDRPGDTAALCSIHTGSNRKYVHTLEALRPGGPGSAWVGVHAALANCMVRAALEGGVLEQQVGLFSELQPEVKFGAGGKSRVDFMLTRPAQPGRPPVMAYLEVKSVTLAEPHVDRPGTSIALFPDTVSERAQRHVTDLMSAAASGHDALCVFLIQRGDCDRFAPDWLRDPTYAQLLGEAAAAGVVCVALRCELTPDGAGGAAFTFLGMADVDLEYRREEGLALLASAAALKGAGKGGGARKAKPKAKAAGTTASLAGGEGGGSGAALEGGGGGGSSGQVLTARGKRARK
ncbi:hypothetical protein FOA52_004797 [Chlamydomonas sp. UWO 241]|nr:hypothetical protein FOA52_004797 [Chlamydomonas sp. UWO 241]